jgi:hypothetical protein
VGTFLIAISRIPISHMGTIRWNLMESGSKILISIIYKTVLRKCGGFSIGAIYLICCDLI